MGTASQEFHSKTQRLDLGMSTAAVEELLGLPAEVSLETIVEPSAKPWPRRVYLYRVDGRGFRVVFEHGEAAGWTLHSFGWVETSR
jgi:hypothetical protein